MKHFHAQLTKLFETGPFWLGVNVTLTVMIFDLLVIWLVRGF